jgi:hypothetical protein
MATITELIKDGELSTLTKLRRYHLRDLTKSLVSTLTDHSILSQSFHSTELLNATVPTMSGSEDGETTLLANNGSSMELPRQSGVSNGRIIHSIFKAMEAHPM